MLMYVYAYYLCLSMLNIWSKFGKNFKGRQINQETEVVRQSHTVPKIGTVCNDYHFACCVNHTRFALANHRPQILCRTENPHHPIQKRKKKTLTIPTS